MKSIRKFFCIFIKFGYIPRISFFREINIMSKTRYVLVLLIGIVFMFVSGCAQEQVEEKKPIKIGVDVFPGWGHVFIAREKGFFEKNGVDVEIVLNEDYLNIQDQFAKNQLDGAFMVYTDAIYAHGYGTDARVVYISDHSISGDVIAAKPELTTVKDLEGKTISVEGINSFSHVFVLSVLEKHGLKEGDFFIKNVGAQEVVAALDRGEIDAGHTYGQSMVIAKEKGYAYLAFAGDVPGMITDILVFHEQIIKQRPDDIQAIVKSLFEAQRFQEANRAEALEIISKATNHTPEEVSVGIDAVKYLNEEENAYAMYEEIEEEGEEVYSLIESGKIIADFYLKRGQLSSIPNFNDIIEPRFVKELAAESQEQK